METLNIMIEFQATRAQRIMALADNFTKQSIQQRTKAVINTVRAELQEIWSDYQKMHLQIFLELPDNERNEKNAYLKSFATTDTIQLKLKSKLDFHAQALEDENDMHQLQQVTQQAPNAQRSRLPHIKIEEFSGDYHRWTSFKSLFTSLIHTKADIPEVEKFHYLLSFLTGDASRIVNHYAITPENYNTAWTELQNRYDNKRVLVNTELKRFMDIPTATIESATKIRNIIDTTKESFNALTNLAVDSTTWEPIIIFLLVQKLDTETHRNWELSLTDPRNLPTLQQFYTFLENRFHALEHLARPQLQSYSTSNDRALQSRTSMESRRPYVNPFKRQTTPSQSFLAQTNRCDICQEQHVFRNCPEFTGATQGKRLELVQQHKRCSNCIGTHDANVCRSSSRCHKCNQRHYTLLHPSIEATEHGISAPYTSAVASLFSGGISVQSQVLLATALVKSKDIHGTEHTLRCLLDQGSQSSFITEEAAQLLRLKRSSVVVPITGLGSFETETANGLVDFTIQSRNATFDIEIQALILSKITNHLPSAAIPFNNWKHISGIELADPMFHQPGRIDVLLGADVGSHIMMTGLITGQVGEPMAQQTRLGWILSGQIGDQSRQRIINSFHHRIDLDHILQRFWELEELPKKKQLTPEEEECESHFMKNYTRDSSGRYTVSLPFKKTVTTIGKSKYRALSRLNQLEKQLNRKPEFKKEYHDVINEYLTLGHMIQSNSKNLHGYYLPHHAVIKESSTTTKLRVVFDASAKSTSGISLNDQLLVGPTVQQTLPDILMRWRTHRIVLSADVTKMYRQIRVKEKDTHFQKILWRTNELHPIMEYRLQTLTFGTASAAFLAIRTLRQLAIDEAEDFKDASQITLNDFYVDDLLTGADNIDDARNLQANVTALLKRGGFELRKWISNSPQILTEIPEELRQVELPLPFDPSDTTKTLGIHYHANTDSFKFKIQLGRIEEHPTKRSLLSESAKLFDPLGWLAPIIIKAKILFQSLWKIKIDWDDKLDAATTQQWLAYRRELQAIEQITIHRWIQHSKLTKSTQIHGFCDASEVAYAAVVYIRVIHADNTITTTMLTAKTKVAPIKSITLPRLELCGAALLADLIHRTAEALSIENAEFFAWTDSSIVLAWLQGHPSRWKTFVANRVAEIGRILNRQHWRHVKSEENPADCASRGVNPSGLKGHPLWWTGPTWLSKSEQNWPKQTENFETENETKNTNINFLLTTTTPLLQEQIERHSSISSLIRVIATCRRVMTNMRKGEVKLLGPLTVNELNSARNVCVRSVQSVQFAREIDCIIRKVNISSNSRLLSLTPFIDDSGLLRVGGRLQLSTLNERKKHPIILPAKHHYTELVIKEAHIRTEHGGVQLTTTLIRHNYWIINARQRVKSIIRNCVICSRYRTTDNHQLMGSLPSVRTTEAPPFFNVAVDYAGPLDLKTSKIRNARSHKCWIALFICMATKAIHIEVVTDLTTQAYLAAFTRFTSRRGSPANIYSDNGTTFVGANKSMTKQFSIMLRDPNIANQLAKNSTQWHFIPPRSPHFGGLWESGIKCMKKHLRKVLGSTMLTYEELTTSLASIEGCLNSRPLTPLTEDPNDFAALTPGHFLIGREIMAPPCESYIETSSNCLSKWRLLQKISQHFWKRWRTEYVSNLQQRHKWRKVIREHQIGDMVLLKDDDSPPSKWNLCRIKEIHPGKDGHVRVVTLKTPTTTLLRAITKLCPLPIYDDESAASLITSN